MEYISKEEARRRLDEAPGDGVFWNSIDNVTYIHAIPQRIAKEKGKELVNCAENISYQDNDFFGMLLLEGILSGKDTSSVSHNLLFPQIE